MLIGMKQPFAMPSIQEDSFGYDDLQRCYLARSTCEEVSSTGTAGTAEYVPCILVPHTE